MNYSKTSDVYELIRNIFATLDTIQKVDLAKIQLDSMVKQASEERKEDIKCQN